MEEQNNTEIGSDSPHSLRELFSAEIREGIDASRDPRNAGLPDLAIRTTTIYSMWFTMRCPECHFKFREDDRVRLCPKCGQAYHDDDQYQLHCWQRHFEENKPCKKERYDPIAEVKQKGCRYTWSGSFSDPAGKTEKESHPVPRIQGVAVQFLRGLERQWSPFGEAEVVEARPGDPMVGNECPWCSYLIRVGDRVVKCPCGKCDVYFHDDIFRHLTCWNNWNGSEGHDFCPVTGEKIEKAPFREGEGADEKSL